MSVIQVQFLNQNALNCAVFETLCLLEQKIFDHDPWTVADFQEFSNILVATVDQIIVGYLVYDLQSQDCVHVYNIGVHCSFQNQGIGTQLLSCLINNMKNVNNVKSVTLEVAVDNAKALALYQKMGFLIEHDLPDYYGPGKNGWFARLNLS
jgi:ribosomal-protein-alanine acetyltransferase